MKQKLFKCLTSNTMSSAMSSVMSRVSNECRMTLDRVSTLLLLLFALSFGFNQEAKANADVASVGAVFSVNNNTEKYAIHKDNWLTCSNCTDWTIKDWTAFNSHNFGSVSSFKLKGVAVSGWRDGSDWFAAKIFYKIYKSGESEPGGNTGEFGVGGFGETGNNPGQYICQTCYNSDGSDKSVIGMDNQNVDLIGSRGPGIYNMKIYTNTEKRYSGGNWDKKTDYAAVTATFTIDPKVTFDSNGGSGSMSTQTVTYNTNTTLTANSFTAPTGHQFNGWNTKSDGSGTSYANNGTIKTTTNVILYAQWTPKSYTITYDPATASNFTYTTAPTSGTYNTNVAMVFTPVTNYVIASVTAYKTGATSTKVTVTKTDDTHYSFTQPAYAVTVKVEVSLSSVQVTYGKSGNGTIVGKVEGTDIGASPASVDGGATVVFTATPSANYTVEGWYANSSCTGDKLQNGDNTGAAKTYTISNIAEDRTVYVKFRETTRTITVVKGTGIASVSPSSTSAYVTTTSANISATLNDGYTTLVWNLGPGITAAAGYSTLSNPIKVNATADGTITATATETLHTVSVASNDGNKGTVSTASVSGVGIATKSASITATPKPGYYFTGWTIPDGVTIAEGTNNSETIKINATADSRAVTANFAPRFYLRGSSTADKEPTKGMPGWDDDAKTNGLFSFISDNTATIDMTLNAATEYKLKLGDLQGNYSWGASSAYEFTNNADLWTFTSNDKNCEAPTFKTAIAGTYTFTIDFSGASPKMKITYPDVPDYTLTVAKTRVYEETTMQNFIAGDGTENNPYQFYLDEKMNLAITALSTVPGVTAYYKFGDDAESSTSLTKDITATTTKQSIVVKAYYKSKIGSYQSAEKTQTIWYQGVAVPALHLTASWNEKEESELSDNPQVTIYYSTDNYNGAATVTQSTDGATPTEFMTITTEKQKNQTYQMANNQPHRYDFAASATVNERSFVAATSVSIYRLVEVRVKDTNHRMTKYYMWINGSNPIQEETAWPGNDFIGKLGDWHIFLVKYPSYTHFVLNNGKAGGADGAEQTVDVQLPASNTCYEIGAKEGTKYTVTDADDCPPILYVGDITNVTLHQGESQLITPEVDLDFGYDESQLQITFPSLPSGFTAVQQGKNFMLTGANQCGATSITVRYTLDGYFVEKTFNATVTHPSNILIQVKVPTFFNWNNHDDMWVYYWGNGLTNTHVKMTWKDCVDNFDRFSAQVPLGNDGKVTFLFHEWTLDGNKQWQQTTNVENVTSSGCYHLADGGDGQKRNWFRDGNDCWASYQVVINMSNGKTYYSNKVENLNDIVSFYAPGKDETGNKSGLVRILRNGTQVATISANTFTKSGIYTAKITANGAGLSDVAPYTGDFYIRTDGAEGGWNNYTKESHKFTYFTPYEGALYDYYWVQNIGKDGNKLSIKACIGNGINENLANMIEASSYTDEYGDITPDSGTGVNLRFGYNPETNYFERSILRGSTAGSNDFLNLVGNNVFNDKSCDNELNEANYSAHADWSKFGDISNWVYEKNVYVKIDGSHQYANALLKSKFNENIIYQLGYTRDPITGAETHTPAQRDILSIGTTTGTYNIRIIYDFKTNRIVSAWSPISDLDIEKDLTINADVLFVRHEEENVAQVNLKNDAAKVSSLNDAYFVLEIDGSTAEKKTGESMYWFSVPFDCEISSIFGVEGYVTLNGNGSPTAGTWGIQTYDGKSRAEKGWYAETATFWRWMRKNETLKKGHGYILVFDRSDANDKGLWKAISREEPCEGTGDGCVDGKKTVTTTVLRLYFPSSESGWQMTRSGEEQWVEYENWTCEKKDRKAQDSNWRLLGTDSYSNIKIDAAKQFERTEKDSVLDIAPYFVYVYDSSKPAYKRYAPISSIGMDFKSFNCYMVQFSGRINWNQYTQSIPEPVAARRIVSENEITNAQMTLSLKKGDATEDNTYIYMDARATTDFDNQMDLTKIVDNRANQVYSVVNGVEYAGNTLPVESQTIPLTVNINASGTYTFSMPDGTSGVSATLIDAQDGSRTDLSMWDYTVDLNKGTFAGRFFIEIDIRKTPTQIDVTNPDMLDENGNPIKTVKFLHEDQLYIQRGQHIYDATGKVVK